MRKFGQSYDTRRKKFGRLAGDPNFAPGEVAEWSIAAVLKTVEGYTSGGSNPSLSADELLPRFRGALFYARNLILIEIPLVLTRFFLLGNFQPFLRPHF